MEEILRERETTEMFWEDFGAKTKKVETRGVLMVILYKDLFFKRKKKKEDLNWLSQK